MNFAEELDVYLDEKGVPHTYDHLEKGFVVKLYDVGRKMFNEVLLPYIRELAERNQGTLSVVRERYGKTTKERVIFIVKGVDVGVSEYQVTWDTNRSSSRTVSSTVRRVSRRKRR